MRVVLDSNVIIAAAISRGLCDAVMESCLEHHELILCEDILVEVQGKLSVKFKAPAGLISDLIGVLRKSARFVEPESTPVEVCTDPDDLMLFGLVKPGGVEAIVTGDKQVLVVETYGGARIISPRQFWELARNG